MSEIVALRGQEVLDSRGRPTVLVYCELKSGVRVSASVPSGASRGTAEAHELRDGDPKRYGGLGCRKAVENVGGVIQKALAGRAFASQAEVDEALIALDGTPNKGRLGANALLGVSLAFARAAALEQGMPLYQYFAQVADLPLETLPRLTVNLFSGGKHAGGQVAIQDVLLVPVSAKTVDESLAQVYAVYQAAVKLIDRKYAMRPLTADEGGLAPAFPDVDTMIQDAVRAIELAGLVPGQELALAIDVASSHFWSDGRYALDGKSLESPQMIEVIGDWVERYPIVSVEDGLAEDDWAHWAALRERIAGKALVLGDDLLCTNPQRIEKAIRSNSADALLLKVNQIGTVSEAAQAGALARNAGWHVTVSARSGETEDNWLGDLAVGWRGNQIKIGSITHSERLAKYNRLLEIEAESKLPLMSF